MNNCCPSPNGRALDTYHESSRPELAGRTVCWELRVRLPVAAFFSLQGTMIYLLHQTSPAKNITWRTWHNNNLCLVRSFVVLIFFSTVNQQRFRSPCFLFTHNLHKNDTTQFFKEWRNRISTSYSVSRRRNALPCV